MKTTLVTITALLHLSSLVAVEYGSLRTYPAGTDSEIITLNDGDVMYVLSQNIDEMINRNDPVQSGSGHWGLMVTYDPGTSNEYILNNKIIPGSTVGRNIIGPATVQLRYQPSTPSSLWYVNYSLTRASKVEYKQANILSLPSGTLGAGTHEIVVEGSDDLQTWTPVYSSTIDGNNTFFRTRVITPTVPDISNYYTKDEVGNLIESNLTNAISLGQQDVISSPSDYGLMGAEGVFDMRVSQPGISTDGDMASMNFTIQSSNDLEEWNNEETIQREYSMPSDKNFMRVSVGPQLEPEPLTTIATDTYGDKLVYDESNNLYVNDENTPLKRNGINLRTDTYSGWNFYAIEPVGNRYLCILKNGNQNVIMFFELDGNYLYNTIVISDLSSYESDFGQSLD